MLVKSKQHRQLVAAAQLFTKSSQQPVRMFAAQPTTEEAKTKEEWGEKYSDECFQFEKEWNAIANKIEKE